MSKTDRDRRKQMLIAERRARPVRRDLLALLAGLTDGTGGQYELVLPVSDGHERDAMLARYERSLFRRMPVVPLHEATESAALWIAEHEPGPWLIWPSRRVKSAEVVYDG